MTSTRVFLCLSLAFLFYAAQGARITFTNKRPYTVWPATLTRDQKPQLSTTGFELAYGASNFVDVPSPWSRRFWTWIGCSSDSGKFTCTIGDCASSQPQFCCTGAYNTEATCPASDYSLIFEQQCFDAYSYAYDDKSSTFTCFIGPNYAITFCP